MKTQGIHAHEDRLLDFAYGELPPAEARLMEQHVQGCSRCSEALEGIQGVRTSMARLPLESAPDAGLESLLAYAQQSARRAAAGPEPTPRWWRRLLAPALGVAAVGVFGTVVLQVNREVDLSPTLKKEAAQEQVARKKDEAKSDTPPSAPAPAAPAPAAAPVPPAVEEMHAQIDERIRAESRAEPMPTKQPPKPVRRFERTDWSNAGAGSGGGFPDKKAYAKGDGEASGMEAFGIKTSRSKRGAALGSSVASEPLAQRAEPARDEDMAEAEPVAEAAMPGESQVAQDVPPSPKWRTGGAAPRPSAVADVASDDEARQAPGRAQVVSAPPPPPPAAQYKPPSEPAAAAPAQLAGVEAKKEKSAPMGHPSPSELLEQAEVASRSGDRAQEAALLRAALAAGAQGRQRVDLLSRLCEAESALGRRQSAIEICKRVTMEAPGSSEARIAQRRLESALQSPADEAASEPRPASPSTR